VARKTAIKRKAGAKGTARAVPVATKNDTDLSEAEQDLLRQLQDGYELETDTLGGDMLLRHPKTGEITRPLSATRNTLKALEERGLIAPGKGDKPLRFVWNLNGSTAAGNQWRSTPSQRSSRRSTNTQTKYK
jgi:hypothetical protein